MIEILKNFLLGLKVPFLVFFMTLLLVFSFIAVGCQGLFNVNAEESQVTLVDTLKGGSSEA